jgi:peptidoglycan/LPS O-acetylase OafA/YrhL
MNRSELHWLTAIRGFAALWVAFHHMGSSLVGVNFSDLGFITMFFNRGWLGVDLFFILSGFIISYCYFGKMESFHFADAKRFWIKRFARVYPAHLVVLISFAVVIVTAMNLGIFEDTQEKYTIAKFITQLLLLNGIGVFNHEGWNLPSWSVSSEFLAYLAFPFIPMILKAFKKPLASIFVIVMLFIIAIVLAHTFNHGTKFMLDFEFTSFRILSEFIMGVMLFHLYQALSPAKGYWLLVMAGFLGVFLQGMITNSFFDFMYLFYFLLIILGLSLIPRGKSIPVLSYLGEISYSLYLVHVLLIILFNQAIRRIDLLSDSMTLTILMFVTAMIVGAAGLFHFIEKPARNIITKKLLS